MLLVEDLISKKRFPVSARDKVVSLGDIAMYTMGEDKPLAEILDLVYENMKGEKIDVKALQAGNGLKDKFGEILEDYDRDRVYPTDIKKLFTWYNILLDAGFTKFVAEEESAEDTAETAAPAEADKA